MSDTLSIIGAFVFGMMLGSGVVGGFIGWMLADDARVVGAIVAWLTAAPGRKALLADVEAEHKRQVLQ